MTVAAALFLGSVALHSLSDGLGGGLELWPWEATAERAVSSHYDQFWWRPRCWVRYDGAPEDAAPGVLLTIPSVLVFGGTSNCAAIRRPIVEWTRRLVDSLPPELLDRLPDWLLEDFR